MTTEDPSPVHDVLFRFGEGVDDFLQRELRVTRFSDLVISFGRICIEYKDQMSKSGHSELAAFKFLQSLQNSRPVCVK